MKSIPTSAPFIIEPVLFLFVVSYTQWQPLLPQLVYRDLMEKYIQSQHNVTTVPCALASLCETSAPVCSKFCVVARDNVAADTSSTMLNIFIMNGLLSAVFAFLWGEYSDRFGRRWPMVASCIAHTIFVSILLVNVTMPGAFNLKYIVPMYLVITLTGGNLITMYVGTLSYISDISSKEARTSRLALAEGMYATGQLIGYAVGGALLRYVGYEATCFSCIGTYCLLAMYCLCLLPEPKCRDPIIHITKLSVHEITGLTNYHTLDTCKQAVEAAPRRFSEVFRDKVVGWTRVKNCFHCKDVGVLLYLNIASQVSFSTPDLIFVIYLIAYPFNFDAHMIGFFLSYKTLILVFICLLFVPRATCKNPDFYSIVVGLCCLVTSYIFFILSQSVLTLLIAATLHGGYGFSRVSFRAMLSKSVTHRMYAKPFAIITGAESVICVITAVMISQVYQHTQHKVHGMCFLVPLVITLINFVIFLFMFGTPCKTKRNRLPSASQPLINSSAE